KAWGMSPGYDRPAHSGFERLADVGCVYCHAGEVAPIENNRYRVAIHEAVIGCESCHGPGALHAQKHAGKTAAGNGEEDLTIVPPDRLTREENESLCAQCHLRASATATIRGRRLTDFRPGQRLIDFRVDYVPDTASGQMKVVGHVEQMRASPCYAKSSTLTCTTCHDPHARPAPAQRIPYYRDKCNACHHEHCGLPRDERLKKNQQGDCAACHMPQRPTDLPHFAFTHHRIGIHAAEEATPPAAKGVVS